MDVYAKVTSKGQVTIPKAVRDALEIKAGDQIVFRVEDRRASVARIPNFLDLAGTIEVPPEWRNAPWKVIREETWRRVAERRTRS